MEPAAKVCNLDPAAPDPNDECRGVDLPGSG
jgi:hypothetical protein